MRLNTNYHALLVNEIVDNAVTLKTEKNTNYVIRIPPFMLFPRLNQALFFERKACLAYLQVNFMYVYI